MVFYSITLQYQLPPTTVASFCIKEYSITVSGIISDTHTSTFLTLAKTTLAVQEISLVTRVLPMCMLNTVHAVRTAFFSLWVLFDLMAAVI